MRMEQNYMAHGGRELVIGGKLTFLQGAEVVNCPGCAGAEAGHPPCAAPFVPDSEAGSVAALRADLNGMIAALREAGILAAGAPEDGQVAGNDPDA